MEPTVTPDPTNQFNQAPQPLPPAPQTPVNPQGQGQFPAQPPMEPGLVTPASWFGGGPVVPPPRAHKWRLPLIAGITVLVLVGGSAAAYFGYYQSSSFIWKQALDNTSQGYDQLIAYSNGQSKAQYKSAKLNGTFKLTDSGVTADGTMQAASAGGNSQGTLSIGASGVRVSVDFRTLKVANSTNPDLYVKASGLQGLGTLLGGSATAPSSLDGADNQWYSIDHTLFDQMESANKQTTANKTLTQADVMDAARALSTVNKQYLFSTNSQTAVATKPVKVSTDTRNNRKAYHYQVTVDKDHLAAYLNAATKAIDQSKLGTWVKSTTSKTAAQSMDTGKLKSDLQKQKTQQVDVWVDAGTRTIQTVRIHDANDPADNYLDVGLNYTGGSKYPFMIGMHNKKGAAVSTLALTTTLDTKAHSLALVGTYASTGGSSKPTQLSLSATVQPSNDAVNVTAPSGAKSLVQLLNGLGLSDALVPGSKPATKTSGNNSSQDADNQVLFQE